MDWFNLLPKCCSGREPKGGKAHASSKSSALESISCIEDSTKIGFPNIITNYPTSNEEFHYSNATPVEFLEETKKLSVQPELTESRRSTNHTIENPDEKIHSPTLNTCICLTEATGYCPLCLQSRYCRVCFEKSHVSSIPSHKFIKYSKKKANFSLIRSDLLKKLN